MSYTTQAELEARFGQAEIAQLTDRVSGEYADAEVVARAIADAEAEIDGYLASRYALPLSVVPPILVRLASDIARYFLYGERGLETVRARYTDAIKILRAIASGEMVMEGSAELAAGAGRNEAAVLPPSRPLAFGRGAQ